MSLQTQIQSRVFYDDQLIHGFLDDCKLRNLTPESMRRYKSSLVIVSRFLNRIGSSLFDLERNVLKEILRYLREERAVSTKTVENYFCALSSFYNYLVFEKIVQINPMSPFMQRYLNQYKNPRNNRGANRKLLSVKEMAKLINSILNPRDKAIITLLAKTGIRRGELIDIDLDDIDWVEQSIMLKPKHKRSNCLVFFDNECAQILANWLRARKNYAIKPDCKSLFVGEQGERLKRHGVYRAVTIHAEKMGYHNPERDKTEDHFTPHCCRHWFTTHLRRNGIRRELLKELRGDSRNEAVDIYDHIDKKELRRAYLAAIPVLGIA